LVSLHEVFDWFRQAKLKLKPTKCQMFQYQIKFFGRIVSRDGVEVDPEKVACVEAYEFPRNVTDLRRYLWLTGYYH